MGEAAPFLICTKSPWCFCFTRRSSLGTFFPQMSYWGLGTWLPLFLYLCHFSVRPILTIPRKSSISILHWCLQMPSSLFCFFLHLSFSRYYTSIYYVYYMFSFSIRSMLQEVGSFVLLKRIFLTDVVSFFLFFLFVYTLFIFFFLLNDIFLMPRVVPGT